MMLLCCSWYLPDYSLAQPLKWGKGLGCDFAMKSCKDWIDSKRSRSESIHPFCDKGESDPDHFVTINVVDHLVTGQ